MNEFFLPLFIWFELYTFYLQNEYYDDFENPVSS